MNITPDWDNPQFEVRTGSHLYGYSTPESDIDSIGFVIPPRDLFLVGLSHARDHDAPTENELKEGALDRTIYTSNRFFDLLLRNETRSLEMLFADDKNILACSKEGQMLRDNASIFITRKLFHRFRGYASSEWRKVRAVEHVVKKRTPTEDTIVDDIRQVFNPEKTLMNEIIRLMYDGHEKVERPITRGLGAQRKEHIEKYGYSCKNAAHVLRLLHEGTSLLTTGKIVFPLSKDMTDLCVRVRTGGSNLEELTELYEAAMTNLREAYDNSQLPDNPDEDVVKELLWEVNGGTL